MMTEMMLQLELSPYLILIMVMALIFLLGWPLEWVPIVLIVVPILLPTVAALDVHGLNPYVLDGLVWNFSSCQSSDSLVIPTGSFICLLFERCCPKLGPERYLFWNDAVYAHPTDRLDTYLYLSSNCTLATKPSLWAVNLCLKKDQQFPILSGH